MRPELSIGPQASQAKLVVVLGEHRRELAHCEGIRGCLRPSRAKIYSVSEYIISGTYFERELDGVSVISAEVQPEDAGFGPVRSGLLVLSARMLPVRVHKVPGATWQGTHETEWAIFSQGKQLPFYPDVQLVSEEDSDSHKFVEIASARKDQQIWEAGLVVKESNSGDGTFERVGMAGYITCETRDTDIWFSGTSISLVRLS